MDQPSADARDISRLLFEQLADLEEGTAAFQYARNTLVEAHMHLVRYAARRYRTLRNGQFEDVLQV
ncbi:RNA polymerase sigma factor SigF, partial [Streptomyces sp. SID7982]|nr:RNA polymerase sigma factor SigF [Streptomyces sp. SID7982]